jgi:type IV pilus assembly protein PilN
MIRINLLAVERAASKKKKSVTLLNGQKMTICCTLVLMLAALFIGWRYWAMSRDSAQLDTDIAAAQQETARLHSVIQQVQQFEQRKAQLQQRVLLIEQLRKSQSGPVHMLDQISRSLPPMLWLTEMKQTGDSVMTIEGRCSTLTGLSEFVGNLEASGYFKRSVEIVSTVTETLPQPPGELIRFVIKAEFQAPAEPVAARR